MEHSNSTVHNVFRMLCAIRYSELTWGWITASVCVMCLLCTFNFTSLFSLPCLCVCRSQVEHHGRSWLQEAALCTERSELLAAGRWTAGRVFHRRRLYHSLQRCLGNSPEVSYSVLQAQNFSFVIRWSHYFGSSVCVCMCASDAVYIILITDAYRGSSSDG